MELDFLNITYFTSINVGELSLGPDGKILYSDKDRFEVINQGIYDFLKENTGGFYYVSEDSFGNTDRHVSFSGLLPCHILVRVCNGYDTIEYHNPSQSNIDLFSFGKPVDGLARKLVEMIESFE